MSENNGNAPMQSDQIGELAKALAAAQGELEAVPKTRLGRIQPNDPAKQGFEYWYADLGACLTELFRVFPKHGLSITSEYLPSEPERVVQRTTLMHSSGQWRSSIMSMPTGDKFDPKKVGIVGAYMRRYSVTALSGLATEDNEDKLPRGRGERAKLGQREEVSHVNRQILEVLGRLGWVQTDSRGRQRGDAAAVAFFEGWARDQQGVDPEKGPGALSLGQLRAFLNVLELEEVNQTDPFSAPHEPEDTAPPPKGAPRTVDPERVAPASMFEPGGKP